MDIWHFALSELLRQGDVSDDVADALASVMPLASATDEDQAGAFRLAIEELAGSCLRTRSFELQPFIDAMAALPMTLEELFDLYIGKNVLNRFRQNHGYKTGNETPGSRFQEYNTRNLNQVKNTGISNQEYTPGI